MIGQTSPIFENPRVYLDVL